VYIVQYNRQKKKHIKELNASKNNFAKLSRNQNANISRLNNIDKSILYHGKKTVKIADALKTQLDSEQEKLNMMVVDNEMEINNMNSELLSNSQKTNNTDYLLTNINTDILNIKNEMQNYDENVLNTTTNKQSINELKTQFNGFENEMTSKINKMVDERIRKNAAAAKKNSAVAESAASVENDDDTENELNNMKSGIVQVYEED